MVTLTPDGKTLVAVAGTDGKGGTGKLQLIDAKKWTRGKALSFEGVPFDVVADDKGRVYVSGGRGEWTDVTVLDTAKGTVAARWGESGVGRSCGWRRTRSDCTSQRRGSAPVTSRRW